jgi:ribonucleotide reductase beta subunit family protein with ferritin-like domain
MMSEPILTATPNRYSLFPIQDQEIFDMYLKAKASFWDVNDFDLSKDKNDWDKLNEDERNYISMILAFFTVSDGLVNDNLSIRFMNEVQLQEAKQFYIFQNAIESIHSHSYSLLIDTYIKDNIKKNQLFDAIHNFDCIKQKTDWTKKWISSNDSFATRLVAFACVEGIFFSGAFCSIYWLKKRGLMPGLCHSNELISRDEALHTEFAILIYSKLINKLSQDVIHSIVKECVEIESYFITESIPCALIGMNSKLMIQYIKFVADRLCVQLGTSKCYNVTNPFDWMIYISLEGKTNMFERKISEYRVNTEQKLSKIDDNDDNEF